MLIPLIAKDLFIAFVIVSIVAVICMRFLKPPLGLKSASAYVATILTLSWFMVQSDLSVWIAAQHRTGRIGYLSEFVRNKRALGGTPSKEVADHLEKLAREGSPCERFHAHYALGKPSALTSDACSSQTPDTAGSARSTPDPIERE